MLAMFLASALVGPVYLEPGIWTDGNMVAVATRGKKAKSTFESDPAASKPSPTDRQAMFYARGDRVGVMSYDRTAPAGTEFWTWCENSDVFPRNWWPSSANDGSYKSVFGQTSALHRMPFPPANAGAAGWATFDSKGTYLEMAMHPGTASRTVYSAARFRRVGGLELVAIGGIYKDADTQIEIGSGTGSMTFSGMKAILNPKFIPGEPVIEAELVDAGSGSIVGHGHIWYAPTPKFADSLYGASERVASDRVYAVFTSTTTLWRNGLRRWLTRE
ncbi:MAG: hypothetical protein M9921_13105 [Fimbriimonadaceae bacterium]|nr:hypothetical protein [Fimbriimonadaceae bacterium]